MSSASTEATLRDWRYGNAQAERLCAALLHLESFEDVDPQHPLGGTRRPERCSLQPQRESVDRGRIFPPTPPSFKDIQAKFEHDFAGVAANGADGFAFFANQPAIGERELLQAKAGAAPLEIYHLERMRFYWIRPKGAGFGSNICGFQ
jgi:hypothetical protein